MDEMSIYHMIEVWSSFVSCKFKAFCLRCDVLKSNGVQYLSCSMSLQKCNTVLSVCRIAVLKE